MICGQHGVAEVTALAHQDVADIVRIDTIRVAFTLRIVGISDMPERKTPIRCRYPARIRPGNGLS